MGSDMMPVELRCEYLSNPLGLDIARPRLSWVLQAPRRARRQSAFQILVASSSDHLLAGAGDLWDSGRVEGSTSVHVVYGGSALQSRQRCWWAVRVWDDQGMVSDYSPPAWWEMGLLHPHDWQALWVSRASAELSEGSGGASDADAAPYLCKPFKVATPVRQARLYISAEGLYEAYINGRRVGDALLTPGWTDYRVRLQYQTYDVTALVQQGANVVGAILGTGWYCGHVGWATERYYGARPRLLAQLEVEDSDGHVETIATDPQWRASIGSILSSDLQMGEAYDARREVVGWSEPSSATDTWPEVVAEDRGSIELVADHADPIRVTEEISPQQIRRLSAATTIVDMGQNMVGWARLTVSGETGTRVQLHFGEALNPDGSLYTANLRGAQQIDSYILRGEGQEVYEPHFTFHGFRYIEVTGFPGIVTAGAITGCVVGSATPPAGTFSCSSPLVNTLQRNIVWCQRSNFVSVPTDCPQRDERLGWLGDAQIFARTASFNRDVAAFFTKWMRDVVDGQSPDGIFPCVAPVLRLRGHELDKGAPAWSDAGVIIPWTLYHCYGDVRIIEQCYDAMVRWLDHLALANPDGLWIHEHYNDYGDWLALDGRARENPFASATPKDLLATAYYAYDARLMARMARALGREDDAARYGALFERIKDAFIAAYMQPDGRLAGDTQTAYALALHMDLVPDALRAAVAGYLVDDIASRGGHMSTGIVGISYLCPVLTETGHVDVAYRLLTNESFPSWGYSIAHGATTIWERWDGWTAEQGFQNPRMNSFNHYALGSIGEWLYRYVAGIDTDPLRPGYEHIIIRPWPGGGLTKVEAEYRSIRGPICSAWTLVDGAFDLKVTIPANTTATVYLPAADLATVTESGCPLADVPDVVVARAHGQQVICEVSSGSYHFTCPV